MFFITFFADNKSCTLERMMRTSVRRVAFCMTHSYNHNQTSIRKSRKLASCRVEQLVELRVKKNGRILPFDYMHPLGAFSAHFLTNP